jgi:hypothetical protein
LAGIGIGEPSNWSSGLACDSRPSGAVRLSPRKYTLARALEKTNAKGAASFYQEAINWAGE